jgi:hypothetical protein
MMKSGDEVVSESLVAVEVGEYRIKMRETRSGKSVRQGYGKFKI